MRKFFRLPLAACAGLWLAGAGATLADTPVTYTDAGRPLFSFDAPDFWILRTGGPREVEDTALKDIRAVSRIMGLRPVTDDKAWLGFVSPAGVASIDEGLRYLADLDKFLVKDPQVSSRVRTLIGGRPAHVVRGTGHRDGTGVSFSASIIDLPGNRVAVAVAVLRAGANPGYADEMNAVFASFRAAN